MTEAPIEIMSADPPEEPNEFQDEDDVAVGSVWHRSADFGEKSRQTKLASTRVWDAYQRAIRNDGFEIVTRDPNADANTEAIEVSAGVFLSRRQKIALDLWNAHVAEHGKPPRGKAIAEACGMTANSAQGLAGDVSRLLSALRVRGLITGDRRSMGRETPKPRSLTIAQRVEASLSGFVGRPNVDATRSQIVEAAVLALGAPTPEPAARVPETVTPAEAEPQPEEPNAENEPMTDSKKTTPTSPEMLERLTAAVRDLTERNGRAPSATQIADSPWFMSGSSQQARKQMVLRELQPLRGTHFAWDRSGVRLLDARQPYDPWKEQEAKEAAAQRPTVTVTAKKEPHTTANFGSAIVGVPVAKIPPPPISETVAGLMARRDEFLEKAEPFLKKAAACSTAIDALGGGQ